MTQKKSEIISTHFDNILESPKNFFSDLASRIDISSFIFEVGSIIGIFFLVYLIQRAIKRSKQFQDLLEQEELTLSEWFMSFVLSVATPGIAFVLLCFAMGVCSNFTKHLEIYQISLKLTMVWAVWILSRMIKDVFVRSIISCTFIPFLILSAFGFAAPVINYLDSLGFYVGDVYISVFLILKGLFIATCLFWGARLISQTVLSFIENKKQINPELRDLLENIFQALLYTVVVLITFDLLGIDLKSLTIIGGAVGIGVGLGLQRIVANFISGVIILFEQKIKVGHLVEVSGAGSPGWIRHLGTRAAVIDTGDGKELLIPNEELLTKTLVDWTSRDKKMRTDLQIKICFHSNLEKAKEIMLDTVRSHPICSKKSPPSCFLEKFTDNGAQFLLQFWVDDLTAGKMDLQNDVLLTIWKRFAEEDIELASYPKVP